MLRCTKKLKMMIKDSDSESESEFSDDLLLEIFGKLPMKSLCRCKSVCKRWYSIIISDPLLLKTYRKSAICISVRKGFDPYSPPTYLCANLSKGVNLFHESLTVPVPYNTKYYGVTQVINGLVCFYGPNRLHLCNLCTGEVIKLPFTHPPKCPYGSPVYRYFFGFEPNSGAYKLLKVYNVWDNYFGYEILTLAGGADDMCDSSWKKVTTLSFYEDVPNKSICIAGTLYWFDVEYKIIAFDLECNDFRIIPNPFHPVPQIPGVKAASCRCHRANLQFRGCLAFLYRYCGKYSIGYLRSQDTWDTHELDLPTELIKLWNTLDPFGSLPTGEILLVERVASEFTRIYSYDPDTQKFERFVVGNFPSLDVICSTKNPTIFLSCFEEKLTNFCPLSVILKQRLSL